MLQLPTTISDIIDAGDSKLTMTSLEIAELTGKAHNNVRADIKKMFEELEVACDDFSSHVPIEIGNGAVRQSPIFCLPKRETLALISGYNVKLRLKIIDRWQELEDHTTPKTELQLAEEYVRVLKEREAAKAEVARLDHKIESNRLYPRIEPEPVGTPISMKNIKALYAPYLSLEKLQLVLRSYGHSRTSFQFGAHENASFTTYQQEDLEDVFAWFKATCLCRRNANRTGLIITHDCFDQSTSRVPKDQAIEFLGYSESYFE